MNRQNKIKEIMEVLKTDEVLLAECVEDLDAWNGFLGDEKLYCMEDLPEVLCGFDTIDILNRAYFGKDADNRNEGASFNPNREYFYFNAYGNLVSTDYKDYSGIVDEYLVEELADNRTWVDATNTDPVLKGMFDELESLGE